MDNRGKKENAPEGPQEGSGPARPWRPAMAAGDDTWTGGAVAMCQEEGAWMTDTTDGRRRWKPAKRIRHEQHDGGGNAASRTKMLT